MSSLARGGRFGNLNLKRTPSRWVADAPRVRPGHHRPSGSFPRAAASSALLGCRDGRCQPLESRQQLAQQQCRWFATGTSDDPFSLVEDDLASLNDDICGLLSTGGEHPVLEAVSSYFFQRGGKNFRPAIVLLMSRATAAHAQQGLEEACPRQQRLAQIAEMIHTASLLHDDVVDESDSRRGQLSVNAQYGNKVAVLAGDFLLARSSMALARLRDCDVVEVLSLVIEELVEGELLQIKVGAGHSANASELMKLYLKKNYLKTGSLIANSCRAAAMLGQHDEEVCTVAYDYGRHLGMAFQLVDDCLDWRSSAADLGKPAMADVKLGLATAPVLLSLDQYPQLSEIVGRRCSEPGDVEQAVEWVTAAGGVERTEDIAAAYAERAIGAIERLQPSAPQRALVSLAEKVLTRSK